MDRVIIRQPLILGQAVKTARKASGLTQVELADAVGTYPRAIIEIERGRSTADLRLLLNVIARVGLEMSIQPSADPQ